jgi:hypothetical protein
MTATIGGTAVVSFDVVLVTGIVSHAADMLVSARGVLRPIDITLAR